MWTAEEIKFLKEYYKEYPIKEIAIEINRTIQEVKDKIYELGLIRKNEKQCRDCLEIKPLTEFYRHSKLDKNIYCKSCDNIRRRNNIILKKIKEDLDKDLQKKIESKLVELATKNIFFECTCCKEKKIGIEFYFDTKKMKRFTRCINCERKYQEEQMIKKIMERGFSNDKESKKL